MTALYIRNPLGDLLAVEPMVREALALASAGDSKGTDILRRAVRAAEDLPGTLNPSAVAALLREALAMPPRVFEVLQSKPEHEGAIGTAMTHALVRALPGCALVVAH